MLQKRNGREIIRLHSELQNHTQSEYDLSILTNGLTTPSRMCGRTSMPAGLMRELLDFHSVTAAL